MTKQSISSELVGTNTPTGGTEDTPFSPGQVHDQNLSWVLLSQKNVSVLLAPSDLSDMVQHI